MYTVRVWAIRRRVSVAAISFRMAVPDSAQCVKDSCFFRFLGPDLAGSGGGPGKGSRWATSAHVSGYMGAADVVRSLYTHQTMIAFNTIRIVEL